MDPVVIVALVAAVASIIGSAIVALSARGKSRVDYKAALDARIDARVTEQLHAAWARIDKQDGEIAGLRKVVKADYRHIKQLRGYIEAGNTGPIPAIPPELIAWHNLN